MVVELLVGGFYQAFTLFLIDALHAKGWLVVEMRTTINRKFVDKEISLKKIDNLLTGRGKLLLMRISLAQRSSLRRSAIGSSSSSGIG